ncbi:hypothetical protein [Legionella bononiensis]|uniref:Coiled-coil protein n=1 Tax=Legionella bononiensis TaxID=2793102 RepID=A0ABS1WFC1_9GAMM|nr:hypothetical protein [Legionella bononiensis]MBL7479302.1 hypothetical protein [Legionella bononiensis]MBL7527970.1 hypothetical protein [Legionella bononiensis]MBL7563953.1 hypothetical protein [Legionella bononiensis]
MADTNPTQNSVQFDPMDQKLIILRMLEDAKSSSTPEIQILIAATQHQLQEDKITTMSEIVKLTNRLIAQIENQDKAAPTLDFLRKNGLYRMMYRYPKTLGQQLPDNNILNTLLRSGFIGVGVSAVLIAAFVTVMLIGAPLWVVAISSGLFVGSSVYLSGLLYGVVNDIFATHANLPYFLLGHQPQQKSLLQTNDKFAQGIAWGVAATFGPVVIASVLFTVAATITAIFVPLATFVMPVFMIAIPLIAVWADFYARSNTNERHCAGSNLYQKEGLDFMSPTPKERGAWWANSDRNLFGFTKVPLIGLGALATVVTLSGVSMFLPAVLFASPLIAVLVPAACAGAAVIALTACGLYMHANRNSHIDDRYNLEFDRDEVIYDLYLDEDLDYAHELLKRKDNFTKVAKKPDLSEQQQEADRNNFSIIFPFRNNTDSIPEVPVDQPTIQYK